MPLINMSGGGSSISGQGGIPGEFLATNYGLTHASDDSMAATNTAALQAAIDAMTTWRADRSHGATLVIPAGRYIINGGISFPSGQFPITVMAYGARFRYPTSGTGGQDTAMFSTPMPTSANDAEVQNDVRDRWRWFGGDFDCRNRTGTRVFDWNATSRMVIRDVSIANVETGIRVRFGLHFRIQDSIFSNCTNYGVRLESENGDWPFWTVANSAGHGAIIDNCRFSAMTGQLAQVRVANTEFTVMNSTFEGLDPVTNIDFANGNNSCLSSSALNLHCENAPTDSHIRLDTTSGFIADFNYATNGIRVNAVNAANVDVQRHGSPSTGADYAGGALFKTASATATRWRFWNGGSGYGGFNPHVAAVWDGGTVSTRIAGPALWGGSNSDGSTTSSYYGNQRVHTGVFGNEAALMITPQGGSDVVVGTQT